MKTFLCFLLTGISFVFNDENIQTNHDFDAYISQYQFYDKESALIGGASILYLDGQFRAQISIKDLKYTIISSGTKNKSYHYIISGENGQKFNIKRDQLEWFPSLNLNFDVLETKSVNDEETIIFKTHQQTINKLSNSKSSFIPFVQTKSNETGILKDFELSGTDFFLNGKLTNLQPAKLSALRFDPSKYGVALEDKDGDEFYMNFFKK